MKKYMLSIMIISFIVGCGGANKSDKKVETGAADSANEVAKNLSANPTYQHGLELTAIYLCSSCHKIDEKLTGPAYRDVANKYADADEATIAKLVKKIIDGGSGVWGEVPMTPHPNLSEKDAKSMVKYILLLKQ